jgi:ribosomal protein S18 acetylase RimI-like enzyme
MIDSDFQRLGFGKLVMDLVHDYVVGRPGGDKVYLSYVPASGSPEHFYKSLGYVDTGQNHGGEVEAVLDLD